VKQAPPESSETKIGQGGDVTRISLALNPGYVRYAPSAVMLPP